jgi:hypothetical protein
MHKAYTLSDRHEFGGLSLWRTQAQAEAWFSKAWFDRVREQRGVEAKVTHFHVWWALEGSNPTGTQLVEGATRSEAVVTWAAAPRTDAERQLRAGADALPHHPGILRQYLGVSGNEVAALTLWANRRVAEQTLKSGADEKLARAFDATPRWTWFNAPVLLPGQTP